MPETAKADDETPPVKCRFKPWWFFGVLLSPAVASLIATPLLFQSEDGKGIQLGLTLLAIASIGAGLFCGIHFTRAQRSLSPGLKCAVGIVSVIGCAGVTWGLAYGGCIAIGLWLYTSGG